MTTKCSPYLRSFWKKHIAHYLLKMIEIWKKRLDKGDKIGFIPVVASITFDTINHSLKYVLTRLKIYLTSDKKVQPTWFCHKVSVYLLPSDMEVYTNSALNNIHKRVLQIVYNDYEKSFNRIVTKINLKNIHEKSLSFLPLKFIISK